MCLPGNSTEGGSGAGKGRNVNADQSVCVCVLCMNWCFFFLLEVCVSQFAGIPSSLFPAVFSISRDLLENGCVRGTTLHNRRRRPPLPIKSVGICVCLVTLNERPLMNANPRTGGWGGSFNNSTTVSNTIEAGRLRFYVRACVLSGVAAPDTVRAPLVG